MMVMEVGPTEGILGTMSQIGPTAGHGRGRIEDQEFHLGMPPQICISCTGYLETAGYLGWNSG